MISWNRPSWSISIEYYMYMIFFVTLLIKGNARFILWVIISFLSFYLLSFEPELMQYVLRGLSSFFAGVLLYTLYNYSYCKIKKNTYLFTFLEFIIIILTVYIISINFEYKFILVNLLFLVMVFIFSFENGFISKILKNKIFLYIGALSYSIYLIHSIIIFVFHSFFIVLKDKFSLVTIIDGRKYFDTGDYFYNNIIILIILITVIILSSFTHKYIEQKGQNIGKALNKRLADKKDKS